MTTIETVKAIRVDHDISLLAAVGYAQAGIDNPLDIESVGCILKRMRNEIAMLEHDARALEQELVVAGRRREEERRALLDLAARIWPLAGTRVDI